MNAPTPASDNTDSSNSAAKLSLLVGFGYRISKEHRLGSLLELLAKEVSQILAAERCSVFLLDHEKNELWSQVAQGIHGKKLHFPITQGVIGYVARTGEAINIPDAYQSPYFNTASDKENNYKTNTILAVPLQDRAGKVLGVFQVLNKYQGTFNDEDMGLLQMLSSLAATTIENAQLYEKIRKSHLETIMRLAMAAEYRDKEDLSGHLKRMSQYSALIAEAMGMPSDAVDTILYASPLHDIGKIGVPDRVLLKADKLNEEEYEEMKKHPYYGAKILENSESALLQAAYNITYAHHENFDGTGYPRGLAGEAIPIEARIVTLADVFDALTSKRVYKHGWTFAETMDFIRENSGKKFDPQVVAALEKCLPDIERVYNDYYQNNGHGQ